MADSAQTPFDYSSLDYSPIGTLLGGWSYHGMNNDGTWNSAWNSALGFNRQQEVIDTMKSMNEKLGLQLTPEELLKGATKFSQDHYNTYGQGYNAGSDPFNIARYSVSNALNDKGMTDVANSLISGTEDYEDKTAASANKYYKDLYNYEAMKQEQENQKNSGGGFGGFIDKFAGPLFGAIAGPIGAIAAGVGKTAGQGGDLGDILKNITPGLLGSALAGGGLDFTSGTSLGNALTGFNPASVPVSVPSVGDILGESAGQGFTPIPGGEQTLTSSLPSSGIGASQGGLGLSDITGVGGNMDWTDILGGWSDWGDAASTIGNTAGAATGDITGIIDQLQNAVSNGSMTLDEAIAQMQNANNAASGGSWLDYLNSGAFPSEATGAVANVGIPDWAKNLPDALKKVLFPSSGTGTGTETKTGGFNLLGALLGGGLGALGGGPKQSGTINTTQTPWGPQQPYLLDAWSKAQAAANSSNPLQTQANTNYQSVLGGPTVNPMLGLDNPYLAKQIDYANQDVTRAMMPAMNQANLASGSFGNSGVADQYGKALTDAYSRNANDMRYKDYYAQQQLQKDAVGNTLGFTRGTAAYNAAPSQEYAKTVGAMNYGSSITAPQYTNKTLDILGGASLGSQIGKLWG